MSIYTTQEDDVFSTLKDFDSSDAVTEPAGYDPVWNEFIKLGGTVQGSRNRETGHIQAIQKLVDHSSAGKKGGLSTAASGKGAVGNLEMRTKSQKSGGSTQGKKNAANGHCKRIAQEYWAKVRSGEIVRKKVLRKPITTI